MALFEKALEAKVMSTTLLIRANVSKATLLEAHKIATDFEERYSAYKEDSFLNQVNAQAALRSTECRAEDILLFKRCQEAWRLTQGEFDISMGALSHGLYHFGFSNQKIATESELAREKSLVDFESVEVRENSIFLKREGMRLDLGGIGKGYVVKLIVEFLHRSGATKALVDVGGEIVSFGKSYTIAIRDPFSSKSIAYIKTSKEPLSISTSGDYERYIQSRENNHILNKKDGKSSNIHSSLTILQNGFEIDMLDAFATALFNKETKYIQDFSKTRELSSISIDKASNISFNNIKELHLSSIEIS